MYLTRFRGETVRNALAQARMALGLDALVLSTQLVAARGWRGLLGASEIEIAAAAERGMSADRTDRPEVRQPVPGRTNLSARLDVAGFAEDVAREMSARREGGRRQASGEGVLLALSAWVAPFAAPFETYAAVDVFVGPMAATPLGESRTGSAA